MKLASLALGLIAPLLVLGGLYTMETSSEQALTSDLVERIEASVPEAEVTHVNLRGRPYFVSKKNHEVSTAYVDIAQLDSRASTMLIVQSLDLDTDRAEHLRVFLTLPAPAGTEPVLAADGSFTNRGMVNGKEISFDATFTDGTVSVGGTGLGNFGSALTPAVDGLRLFGDMSVTNDGLLIELVGDGVELAS